MGGNSPGTVEISNRPAYHAACAIFNGLANQLAHPGILDWNLDRIDHLQRETDFDGTPEDKVLPGEREK
ncbi:Hypothetical protein (plasmid) [Pseudomonas putida]|nr:Hypothetical protein [Pseudomonas putida]